MIFWNSWDVTVYVNKLKMGTGGGDSNTVACYIWIGSAHICFWDRMQTEGLVQFLYGEPRAACPTVLLSRPPQKVHDWKLWIGHRPKIQGNVQTTVDVNVLSQAQFVGWRNKSAVMRVDTGQVEEKTHEMLTDMEKLGREVPLISALPDFIIL